MTGALTVSLKQRKKRFSKIVSLLEKVIVYYNQDGGTYCDYVVTPKTLAEDEVHFIELYLGRIYKKDYQNAKKVAFEFCRYLTHDKITEDTTE